MYSMKDQAALDMWEVVRLMTMCQLRKVVQLCVLFQCHPRDYPILT